MTDLNESQSEKAIKIAAKLYDARDTMRCFWHRRYPEQIANYQGHSGYLRLKRHAEG